MSKRVLKQYMELPKVGQTFLTWEEQKYSVKDAPPRVFDGWIRQVVDRIVNVDTDEWELFHRWQIINAALDGKFLQLRLESGTFFLQVANQSEEKSSELIAGNAGETASEAV